MHRHLFLWLCLALAHVAPAAGLSDRDHVLLHEFLRVSSATGERIWPGWQDVPPALLLISGDQDYLLWHPSPSDEFVTLGRDETLRTEVLARPSGFDGALLATYPAVHGIPTIVVGTPEDTSLPSTLWVVTLLHEHFHQMQMSLPDYYSRLNALQLSGGDESGMWMLNYPFPYTDTRIGDLLSELGSVLAHGLEYQDDTRASLHRGTRLLEQLRDALEERDYRYLQFQLWQEGVARYVQYRGLALWRDETVSKRFRVLDDYEPPSLVGARAMSDLVAELRGVDPARDGRVAFYPLGAAWALLLDRVEPAWRERYFAEPFALPGAPAR